MLDRKIKDYDASIELLEDREKQAEVWFMLFYVLGAVLVLSPILLTSIYFSIVLIGAGIAFLIIATLILIAYLQLEFYLFLIHKKVVKATDKRGK